MLLSVMWLPGRRACTASTKAVGAGVDTARPGLIWIEKSRKLGPGVRPYAIEGGKTEMNKLANAVDFPQQPLEHRA
jgi:hypothetical protein